MRAWMLFLVMCLAAFTVHAGTVLTGTWSGSADGEPLTVTFAADGTGTANGDAMRWQLMGTLLFVEQGGAVSAYQVQQDGDKLSVAGGSFASVVVLTRVAPPKAAQATQPASKQAAKPATPAGGTAATAGNGRELVGKWCKGGAFSAVSGGGSSSMTCFELKADGGYTYEHEGSLSAYGSGYYGGTASQDSDSGQWSVSGNTLTARSASGSVTTYPLQKRNHPKTGDPQICLDGDCYVTYWQKAPW